MQEETYALVLNVAARVVEKIGEVSRLGKPKLELCAAYGISCEGWWKIELLSSLSEAFRENQSVQLLPEWQWKMKDIPRKQSVDIVVEAGQKRRVLLELKTFPTNYGRSGKPITNFVEGVGRDLVKLAHMRGNGDKGLVAWMAYPVPDSRIGLWKTHVEKVESHASATRCREKVHLWKDVFAHLYVMETR